VSTGPGGGIAGSYSPAIALHELDLDVSLPSLALGLRQGCRFGSTLDRGGVLGVVDAELAFVVDVEVVLAIGSFPVLLPGLCLVGTDSLGDLRP